MKFFKSSLVICICCLAVAAPPSYSIDIDTSSPFVYPEYSKKISMDFESASLVDVLKIFSKQTNLNLVASNNVKGKTVTVYLDDVPVEQALEQILRANDLTYEIQPGSDIYIVKPLLKPGVELTTRVYPLKHASVSSAEINNLISVGESSSSKANILTVIKSILSNQGDIQEDARTNSLIVTDIATNFPIIEQTIARLDITVPQILIEVEMLEVAKSITDQAGINWSGTFLTLKGAAKYNAFPFDGSVPFIEDPGGIDYEDARLLFATGDSVSGLDARALTATIQFIKSQTDTKNLARPTVLTLNNKAAEIKIATDEAIGVIEQSDSDSAFVSYDAERVETGVSLIVTPQANIETGVITMAVEPKFTVAKTGKDFGTGTTFKDPEERSVKTTLKINDGDTIIIGGLIREERTELNKKVPILGDIPFIGKAFQYKDIDAEERELLIFITPHILEDPTGIKKADIGQQHLLREQNAP